MRLILSVDALAPSLTGIGRYVWELVSRVGQDPRVTDLRFYRNQRWIADPDALLVPPLAPTDNAGRKKRKLIKYPVWAKDWYWRQSFRGSVFHAPNYFLPPQAERGVVTVHDLSVFKFPETHPLERIQQWERSFRQTIDSAVHLITDTQAVRHEVIEHLGWPAERITAVHLGVTPEFRPRPAAELADDLARFGLQAGSYSLCVATIEPRKRVGALITAYERLPRALRGAYPLVLVGGRGWQSEPLHERIERAQQEGWLRYLGYVDGAALPLLYAGARLFAYPSIYEGFGLPVAEAMASGVPVLTSNKSCLPEVAGGAAWLVDPDDDDALLEGLQHGLTDEPWRAQAASAGLQVAARYTWEACAHETVDVYAKLSASSEPTYGPYRTRPRGLG